MLKTNVVQSGAFRISEFLFAQQLYIPLRLYFCLFVCPWSVEYRIAHPTKQNKVNQSKPNQTKILKHLRCPKMLRNSCTNPYLFIAVWRRNIYEILCRRRPVEADPGTCDCTVPVNSLCFRFCPNQAQQQSSSWCPH